MNSRPQGSARRLRPPFAEIGRKIEELVAIGGTQVLMQGGLGPADMLPSQWYLDLLRFIKRDFPRHPRSRVQPAGDLRFHEIFEHAHPRRAPAACRRPGSTPSPAAAPRSSSIASATRSAAARRDTAEYLEVMRQAHLIGMRTSITMMFGHIETIAERIEHLRPHSRSAGRDRRLYRVHLLDFPTRHTPLGRTARITRRPPWPPDGKHLVWPVHTSTSRCSPSPAVSGQRPQPAGHLGHAGAEDRPARPVLRGQRHGLGDDGGKRRRPRPARRIGWMRTRFAGLITEAGWQPSKRDCYYTLLDTPT